MRYVLIFAASGAGGALRYWISGRIQDWLGTAFPWATLFVNVSGCFGIGLCTAAFAGALPIRDDYRVAIIVGLFGGYTTFSSFGRETMALVDDNQWTRAALYVAGSNVLGLFAVWLGALLGGKLPSSNIL